MSILKKYFYFYFYFSGVPRVLAAGNCAPTMAASTMAALARTSCVVTIGPSETTLGARLGTVLLPRAGRIVVELTEVTRDGALASLGCQRGDWIEEVAGQSLDLMGFFDTDGDGSVTHDELVAALTQIRSLAPAADAAAAKESVVQQARRLMKTFDADGNGTLEATELCLMLNSVVLQHVIALLYSVRPLELSVTRAAVDTAPSPRRHRAAFGVGDALAFARRGEMVSQRGSLRKWKGRWLQLAPGATDLSLSARAVYDAERVIHIAAVEGGAAKHELVVRDVLIGCDAAAYGTPSENVAPTSGYGYVAEDATVDALNQQLARSNGFTDAVDCPYRVFGVIVAERAKPMYFAAPDEGMKRWVDALCAIVGKEAPYATAGGATTTRRWASVVSV
tara:strand:+ start:112 stop:1290 length:1179 start_codon:yes stop_codon:yes gene_type:complete